MRPLFTFFVLCFPYPNEIVGFAVLQESFRLKFTLAVLLHQIRTCATKMLSNNYIPTRYLEFKPTLLQKLGISYKRFEIVYLMPKR